MTAIRRQCAVISGLVFPHNMDRNDQLELTLVDLARLLREGRG